MPAPGGCAARRRRAASGGWGLSDQRELELELRIGGERLRLSARVPEAPLSLADFLPVFRSFADLIVQVAAREATALGRPPRCAPRCGACCRQPVPIAPAEALDLRHVVATLAPDHRERVLARFAKARERLAAAGLLERLRADSGRAAGGAGARRALGLEYFALGIPCAFLEEESCSIYADRPLACREYLVSSEPANCSRPEAAAVAVIEVPRRLSMLLFDLSAEDLPDGPAWLPLALALDETLFDAAAAGAATRPGPALFERVIAFLACLYTGSPGDRAASAAAFTEGGTSQ